MPSFRAANPVADRAMTPFPFPDLESERLQLRILTLGDAEVVLRHFSDERVTRMMDIEPCQSLEEAQEIIAFHERDSGCRWGLWEQESAAFLGTCGFHCWLREENRSVAEVGFDVAAACWGRGLMHEALRVVLPFGFEKMKVELIRASVDPGNLRSIRLLERLGFVADDEMQEGQRWFGLRDERFPR